MVPRTVLTRSGLISLHTARPVNIVQPRTTVNNARHIKMLLIMHIQLLEGLFNKLKATNNSSFTKKVNIVKGTRVNTDRPKVVLSAVKGNKGNVVKASAYLRNISYLKDYEEIDGGFIAFADFKLTDESHVLLNVPRKDNMYSVDLKNVVP
ncbi:hypothetical protein Tco_1311223 [Tanacetum coccineum]